MLVFDRGQLATILCGGHHPQCAAGKIDRAARGKRFPLILLINLWSSLPGRGKVAFDHLTILMAYLQAAILVEICTMYFRRGGLFRNDKDADSLVELGAPFSVRCGISRR
jgi:hypothetical protein